MRVALQGVYLGFCLPPPHGISPISKIRIHINRIKTPDSSGDKPSFANKPHSEYYSIKCDNFYHPEADGGISILDDSLGIDWKKPNRSCQPIRQRYKACLLKDFDSPFNVNVDLYK